MPRPSDLRYTDTHLWVRFAADAATIGITDYAQDQLGDVVYLDLPAIGTTVTKDQPFGLVESLKASQELLAPLDGEVVARNEEAVNQPDLLNASPFDRGWLIAVGSTEPGQSEELLDAAAYERLLPSDTA